MDTCLCNLAADSTQEKDALDKLVTNNEKMIYQLEILTTKFNQLSSKSGSTNSSVPMIK